MNKLISKLTRSVLSLILGVGVITNLTGCVVALVGGAVATTALVSSDRRTVGSQTEDATIEVKAANRIDTVFGEEVHVSATSYNRNVLLTGEVKDEATKMEVEKEIKRIENVASVINELQISAFLSGFGSRSSDALLTTKVRSRLLGTPDIYSSSFKVVTENGVVYLMGRVSQREGDTAAEATREVAGVQKVVKVFEYIDENEVRNYQKNSAPSA